MQQQDAGGSDGGIPEMGSGAWCGAEVSGGVFGARGVGEDWEWLRSSDHKRSLERMSEVQQQYVELDDERQTQ